MFSKVYGCGIRGIDGYLVSVEADARDGLPVFRMIGYLAAEVREAEDRVRTAIKNSGFSLQPRKITVNLAPAGVRKAGTGYDLAIAVAVLKAYGLLSEHCGDDAAFIGELGLNGEVREVRGVLAMTEELKKQGIRRCYLPEGNVEEGLAIGEVEIVGVKSLTHLTDMLVGRRKTEVAVSGNFYGDGMPGFDCDFSEIKGHPLLKRAALTAVAGMHNLLIIGPAGSGKSMIAKRIPTIMPQMSREESLEISKVYSICGMLPKGQALLTRRPFRGPHHTIGVHSLIGGGTMPRPGEISLADRGVLFLDELPEFPGKVLEALRQPLEDGKVTISRLHGSYEFPAKVMLTAAMNPCKCGFYPDRSRCSCTTEQVHRYLGRISRPLLDRFDIGVEVAPVSYQILMGKRKEETSAEIRKKVERAREIQRERFQKNGIYFNSEMRGQEIEKYCALDDAGKKLLERVCEEKQVSARACHKLLRVARTIADLEGAEAISAIHLSEAVNYRRMDEIYWNQRED